MLRCDIAEFLFEKCEGAVESSSGMLFYKVIRSGSIPERWVFVFFLCLRYPGDAHSE